ncbi:MAG: helix-turn-helix transcriptional regulator [Parasphingopyxis sp.]|nr:helix-turn-helix transcriptional regulator [Sphingomonadales bacterium]
MATTQNPFDSLSEEQRDCLRMVFEHMTSKDIARRLGISHHTVDQRIKTAMRLLDAPSRVEAARMLARHENRHRPLVYQSPEIESPPSDRPDRTPIHQQGTPTGHAGYAIHEARAEFAFRPESFIGRPFASPRPWGARNDLTTIQRLAAIVAIAIGSALSFGAVTAGLEALTRIV